MKRRQRVYAHAATVRLPLDYLRMTTVLPAFLPVISGEEGV